MQKKLLLISTFTCFIFIALILTFQTKVSAATRTWDGSDSNDWNDAGNWDAPVVSGDDLVFPNAPGGFTTNLDCTFAPVIFDSITFEDNYTVSCVTLYVNDLIDQTGDFTVDIDAAIQAQDNLIIRSEGTLNLNGSIDLNGHNLSFYHGFLATGPINVYSNIVGTGTNLNLVGDTETHFFGTNSFSATVNIAGGPLVLESENATGASSNTINVGDGVVLASMRSNIDGGVTSGSVVVVESGETWDLNGFEEGPGELTGSGTVIVDNGATLILGDLGGSFTTNNIFEGDGEIIKTGFGTMSLYGDSPAFTGDFNIGGGTVMLNAEFGNADVTLGGGSVLYGIGNIGSLSGAGGTVAPGNSPGIMTVDGNVTWNTNFTYEVELGGTTVGTEYDQLSATGTVNLGGATLSILLGYPVVLGDSYTIIHADSGITGIFNGLPNFSSFIAGGSEFLVEYEANDVILTAIATLFNPSFTATPNPAVVGSNVTIVSTWTGTAGTPTGTAELFDGATSLGTVSLVGGVATYNISSLSAGVHSLTVQYSGDGSYNGAISNSLSLTISASLSNTGTQVPLEILMVMLTFSLGGVLVLNKSEKFMRFNSLALW